MKTKFTKDMKTIYIPEISVNGDKIVIDSSYFVNYIKNVLRYNINDEINISNNGVKYNTLISKITKKIIEMDIKLKEELDILKKRKITLIQSLFAWPRLEWLVEKSVELGVDEIIFIQTERSKLKINNWNSKKERLNKIIYKALTQSHQTLPIMINEPVKLENLDLSDGFKIIFDTKDENLTFSSSILNNSEQDIFVAIGPEGGFSDKEMIFFNDLGFKSYKIPLPILRAETAAIAAMVLVIAK